MSLNISYLARKKGYSSIKKVSFWNHGGARRPRGARTTMKTTRGRGAGRGQAAPTPQQAHTVAGWGTTEVFKGSHFQPVGIPPWVARGVRGVGGTKRKWRACARNLLERHAYRLARARICARFPGTLQRHRGRGTSKHKK